MPSSPLASPGPRSSGRPIVWPGRAYPLGATYDGTGTNFSVFSDVGDRVELCLFDTNGRETRVELPERSAYIHHGFLPSFKGARPYTQAYDKGVKLIGATAHYVTTDLDEGPIIEQEVARVDHTHTPEDLAAIGRDTECMVLARALKYHAQHRVLLNGHKTVVFR